MGWTSLFLDVNGKNVFILGTGEVAHRRADRFLENGSKVILSGNKISKDLSDKGAILEEDGSKETYKKLVEWADIVVVASGDKTNNDYVSLISKDKLLNRADFPEKGNLAVPTSFYIDDVQISIFTNGKSPLMARELRKKIQNIVSDEDILQIKLQDFSRKILKEKFDNQKVRKEYLYKILNNSNISKLLKEGKLKEAKNYVEKIINNNDNSNDHNNDHNNDNNND
ncbi:bifunctional precorrin-2 dehydrogenase/sirohydrochlorin ferrochelatase [Methanobrevibacter arboriphilus]|uniref:precorrin-2 dehydrogenase/sirohydrochlorin ferrochelatase family protein n=1 Tax=Methanobrevibacter arboriphilus TaxID=39441 RepID=UPI0005B29313|nr:bifunctional precorrin-2 dehydrogenase/sirohydrochlorin ferrochelatase [Methanobrevibacter arboriphilus]